MHRNDEDVINQARMILLMEAQAVKALADQLNSAFIEVLNTMLNCKGHILTAGAGTSHAVAQRFAHLLSCSGTPALCIDAEDALHGGSGAVRAEDVVYVISKGGHSKSVNAFISIAKSRGAKIITQTENVDSPLAQMSDAVYHVVAPKDVDPYGMVATGSSLVNSAAGDILCAILMNLRGYTKESFAVTHPGGAVGMKLEEEVK
jgi:arabinose-5-phosphate isomerase